MDDESVQSQDQSKTPQTTDRVEGGSLSPNWFDRLLGS